MNRDRTEPMEPSSPSPRSSFGPFLVALLLPGIFTGCATFRSAHEKPGSEAFYSLTPSPVVKPEGTEFSEALAWFSLALVHELEEEPALALRAYQEAVRRDPGNITLAMLASQRLQQAGRPRDAVALMESILAREPDNFQALIWCARLHLQQEDEAAALPLVLHAAEVQPRHEGPWLEGIRLKLRAGDEAGAIALAEKALNQAENPARVARIYAELLFRRVLQAPADSEERRVLRDTTRARIDPLRRRFPADPSLAFMVLALDIESGRRDEVFPLLRELDAAHAPDSQVRPQILVQFTRAMNGPPGALRELHKILKEDPNDLLALYLNGMLQELMRRPDLALPLYLRAAEAHPEDLPSQRKVAVLFYQTGQPRRAVRSLDAVLSRRPDDPELLLLAGHLNLAVENFAEAARQFQRLELLLRQGVTLENPAQVHAGLAMAQLALENDRGAVDALVLLGTTDPSALETVWRHQLSRALQVRDRPQEQDRLQRLLLEVLLDLSDRLPETPEVEYLIARTHSVRREYAETLAALDRMAEIAADKENPETWLNADYHFDRGAALERLGRLEEAFIAFDRALAIDPDHAQTLNYVAYMWAERGQNLEKAMDYIRRALRQYPDNGSYIDTLGWVYYQQGNFTEAYRHLRRAAELEPEESVIVEHLGDTALRLNRPVEAAGYYRIALQIGAAEREETVRASLRRAEDAIAEMLQAVAASPAPGSAE